MSVVNNGATASERRVQISGRLNRRRIHGGSRKICRHKGRLGDFECEAKIRWGRASARNQAGKAAACARDRAEEAAARAARERLEVIKTGPGTVQHGGGGTGGSGIGNIFW